MAAAPTGQVRLERDGNVAVVWIDNPPINAGSATVRAGLLLAIDTVAHDLKTWPLLDGFRGRPKADIEALVDAIVAFSRMAAQLGERLVEAEINPVFVLPQGQGVRAADGVVVLA